MPLQPVTETTVLHKVSCSEGTYGKYDTHNKDNPTTKLTLYWRLETDIYGVFTAGIYVFVLRNIRDNSEGE